MLYGKIDLNKLIDNTTTVAYGVTVADLETDKQKEPRQLAQSRIEMFAQNYRGWIFEYAEFLLSHPEKRRDSKYAVVAILNSCVDMIGKLHLEKEDRKCVKKRVFQGLKTIFIGIEAQPEWKNISETFYMQFRNGVAHGGVVRGVYLADDADEDKYGAIIPPLGWGRDPRDGKFTLVINVPAYFEVLRNHVERYVHDILNAPDTDRRRQNFLEALSSIG